MHCVCMTRSGVLCLQKRPDAFALQGDLRCSGLGIEWCATKMVRLAAWIFDDFCMTSGPLDASCHVAPDTLYWGPNCLRTTERSEGPGGQQVTQLFQVILWEQDVNTVLSRWLCGVEPAKMPVAQFQNHDMNGIILERTSTIEIWNLKKSRNHKSASQEIPLIYSVHFVLEEVPPVHEPKRKVLVPQLHSSSGESTVSYPRMRRNCSTVMSTMRSEEAANHWCLKIQRWSIQFKRFSESNIPGVS